METSMDPAVPAWEFTSCGTQEVFSEENGAVPESEETRFFEALLSKEKLEHAEGKTVYQLVTSWLHAKSSIPPQLRGKMK